MNLGTSGANLKAYALAKDERSMGEIEAERSETRSWCMLELVVCWQSTSVAQAKRHGIIGFPPRRPIHDSHLVRLGSST